MLAGLREFTKGNTFGSTAFCAYGAFRLAFWWLVTHGAPAMAAADATEDDIGQAVGTFLLVRTISTSYLFIASLNTTAAIAAVFLALAVTFSLLCIGAYGESEGMTRTGGRLGLVTAMLAFHASFAGVTNSTLTRTVLPVVPL